MGAGKWCRMTGAKKAHVYAANKVRVISENEKPLAMAGGWLFVL